jgi:DNA-binding beta-propeller fold protein YncE
MRLLRSCVLPAAAVFAAAIGVAQSTPNPALLVLSKTDHALAIVDPTSLKVVGHVPVGDDPHEIVASSDGKFAYVSNYGFGAFHTIMPIDLVAQRQLQPIDLGALRGPHGLMFQEGKVWFTAEAARAIGSYNPATGKIDWVMGLGQNRTHMIYVFPGARRIATTNVNSGTVTILNEFETHAGNGPPPSMGPGPQGGPPPGPPPGAPQGTPPGAILPPGNDWELTNIAAGERNEGFDVSPDLKQLWTVSPVDGKVYMIDVNEKKLIGTIDTNAQRANRLKFTPDGKLALISAGSELVVVDVASRKAIQRIAIGHGSGGVLIQPDGARAFVACSPDNSVAVIDLKTFAIVGRIEPGGNPDGMAWAVR